MNCINHPETPVASYCQNCGKALCSECTRPVGGFIYCEQCLAAKVGVPSAQPGAPFPPGVPASSVRGKSGAGNDSGHHSRRRRHVQRPVREGHDSCAGLRHSDRHHRPARFLRILHRRLGAVSDLRRQPDRQGPTRRACRCPTLSASTSSRIGIGTQYPGVVPPSGTPGAGPGRSAGDGCSAGGISSSAYPSAAPAKSASGLVRRRSLSSLYSAGRCVHAAPAGHKLSAATAVSRYAAAISRGGAAQ